MSGSPRDLPDGRSGWALRALWAAQIVVALPFFAAGGAKVVGLAPMVAIFEKIGIGQWFRYVTALVEISGAVLLLIPRLAVVGAALLGCTMTGATIVHLGVIGGNPVPALILLALNLVIVWLRRAELSLIWRSAAGSATEVGP
jgi:putative oxidoreductase